MDSISNRSAARSAAIALFLFTALSLPAAAQSRGALIKGCDGSICVIGSFDGRKWQTATEKDQRSSKSPTITYSGFAPETITIYTGKKSLVWADGELTTGEDDRPYKVPSATATAIGR